MGSKMNTKEKLLEWFKSMGYDGKLPESLDNVCNPSTFFIWEQIIEKVKPKQDVEIYRRNIIMNRLKSKSLKHQDEFPYPITDIERYIKKSQLESNIDELKSAVLEKEVNLDKLTQDIKTKCALGDNLKQKVKEYEERAYLFEKKSTLLESEITHAQDMVTQAKNLTPVESDENPKTIEITETLRKCSEKLEKLINNTSQLSTNEGACTILRTARKTGKKYTQSVRKQVYSTTKKMQSSKKNGNAPTVAKALCFEDNRKLGYTICLSEVNSNRCTRDKATIITEKLEYMTPNDEENKENKEESLGILPEICLDFPFNEPLGEVDVFKTPDKGYEMLKIFQPSARKQLTPIDDKYLSLSVMCEDKCTENIHERLCKDEFIVESIRNMIHSHNRPVIWNSVETMCENLLSEMQNSIIHFGTSTCGKDKVDKNDITKLHYVHIKTELDAMKYKATNYELLHQIKKIKKQVTRTLLMNPLLKDKQAEVQRLMDLQIQEAKLDAVIGCMKKEINASRKMENTNELQMVNDKIRSVRQEALCKLNLIQEHMEEVDKIFESINRTRDDTTCCVRRLNRFMSDMQWVFPLTENLHSKEISTFIDFPIEYNRRFSYTDPKIFFRNICSNVFPSYLNLDSNQLNMLVSLLENPFTPPEVVIAKILKSKLRLSTMNSIQNPPSEVNLTERSYSQLKSQENYVQNALDKLNFILHSPVNLQVFSSPAKMKEIMELWKEMPFRNYISSKRLVKEKTYSCFEDQFNSFYNSL